MKTLPNQERGASLIIAVAIIAILIMAGTVVLDAVHSDTQLGKADDAAQNAGYIAEAGAVWGQDTLLTLLYPVGSGPSDAAQIANLTAKTALAAGDDLCPDGVVCAQWYLLTPTAWVTYGPANGSYRVAATCIPTCGSASPNVFMIRSMGKLPGGAKRLVEVTMGQ